MSLLPGMFPAAVAARAQAAAPAFPQVVATNTGNLSSANATYNAPLPASIQAGDLLVVFIGCSNGTGGTTIGTPSGWTQLYTQAGGGNMRRHAAYYRVADGGEGATQAFTASNASIWASTACRITGYQGTPEAGTPATGNSTAPNPPSLTPSWGSAKTLWLAGMAATTASGGATTTAPASYTNQLTDVGTLAGLAFPRVSSAQRELEASPEDPGTFTLSATAQWVAGTVAVRPA
jgi:hypothetical protein